MPIMRELAEELESTVVLLVREGEEVVGDRRRRADKRHRTTWPFAPAADTRWVAAPPVSACSRRCPPRPGERPEVTRARTQGFAVSKGEVEPGAHGLAVLIHQGGGAPGACLNLITYRDDVMAARRPGDAGRRRPDQRTAELNGRSRSASGRCRVARRPPRARARSRPTC